MFESIDRPVDHETRRRSAMSFALTTCFYASLAGGIAGFLTWQVEPDPAPIVERPLTLFEPPVEDELPGPPALKTKPEAAQAAASPKGAPEPTEPTEPVEPTELVPVTQTEVQPSNKPGIPDGQDISGPPSGPQGCSGPDCGEGAGGGGGAGVTIHRLQLEPRKRVEPRYPEAARALGLGHQRCVALVSVDEEGIPYDVEISGCPLAFHPATREALLAWRFYPPKMGKSRVKAQMNIAVTYRLEE
jgi:outer membrane biosynthesis protein TonB